MLGAESVSQRLRLALPCLALALPTPAGPVCLLSREGHFWKLPFPPLSSHFPLPSGKLPTSQWPKSLPLPNRVPKVSACAARPGRARFSARACWKRVVAWGGARVGRGRHVEGGGAESVGQWWPATSHGWEVARTGWVHCKTTVTQVCNGCHVSTLSGANGGRRGRPLPCSRRRGHQQAQPR